MSRHDRRRARDQRLSGPYEPLNTLKRVADDVWVVDGPVIDMAFPLGVKVPFPTRMTLVRLSDGGLWIHSPTTLTPALKAEVEALGPVRHLVAPNWLHYAGIPQWAEAFPQAKTWAASGTRRRARSQGIDVRIDAELDEGAAEAWAKDLEQLTFAGSRFLDEVVFFHRASRTLVLADLIQSFEPQTLSAPLRWILGLAGSLDPDGRTPIDLRVSFVGRRDEARACLTRMLEWEPERVVLSHGRWYTTDGTAELRRAFRWLT